VDLSTVVGSSRAALSGLVGAVAGQVKARVPEADLDDRDPDYIRDNLPGLWLLASFYFRARVRGLEVCLSQSHRSGSELRLIGGAPAVGFGFL
jgi:hypothetical protein